MSGFRIIKEQTHKYNKTDTIYVLMFREGITYGIDVADNNKGFGRCAFDTKEQAEYVFERLNDTIFEINDYTATCQYCNSLLRGETFADIVLFLHTVKRYVNKGEIYALIYMLNLSKEETYKDGIPITISVGYKDSEEIIGKFILNKQKGKFYFVYF